MEIVVRSRHTDVDDRFRQHAEEKLSKLDRLDHKAARLDVEVSREHNPRLSAVGDRVELTCHSKGPVIRAEAAAADPYAALDLAAAKLQARLRRAADRRRVHHGSRTPLSVAAALAPLAEEAPRPDAPAAAGDSTGAPGLPPAAAATTAAAAQTTPGAPAAAAGADTGATRVATAPEADTAPEANATAAGAATTPEEHEDARLVVREKVHRADPMTLDQALFEMELVGHDFFLFADADTGRPSVVYRRRGYAYGVLRLEA